MAAAAVKRHRLLPETKLSRKGCVLSGADVPSPSALRRSQLEAVATETDWWKLSLEVIGAGGGLAGVLAIVLHFTHSADAVERWVDEDPGYRDQLVRELRGGRIAGVYFCALASALDWLDRHSGSARSSRALVICIVIAICYACGAFFLSWGIGGPGDVGGVLLLDDGIGWSVRLPFAITWIVGPPVAFVLGRWLGRQERRLKLVVRRRQRWRQLHFELVYRGILIGSVGAAGLIAVEPRLEAVLAVPLYFGAPFCDWPGCRSHGWKLFAIRSAP